MESSISSVDTTSLAQQITDENTVTPPGKLNVENEKNNSSDQSENVSQQGCETLLSPAIPSNDTLNQLHAQFRVIAIKAQADMERLEERMNAQQKRKAMAEKRVITMLYQFNRTIEQLFRQNASFSSNLLDLQVMKHYIQDLVICMQDVGSANEDYGATEGEATLNQSLSTVIKHAEALRKAHGQAMIELADAKQSLEEQKHLTSKYETMVNELNTQIAILEAEKTSEPASPLRGESNLVRFQKVASLAAARSNNFTRTLQGLAQSVNSAARISRQQESDNMDLTDSETNRLGCEGHAHVSGALHKECHQTSCPVVTGKAQSCSCASELLKDSITSGKYRNAWFHLLRLCGTESKQLRRRSIMYIREFRHHNPSVLRWSIGGLSLIFAIFLLVLAMLTSRGAPST